MTPTVVYGTAVTRQARARPVRHIAELIRGPKWVQTRHGSALCGTLVQPYPEPEDAEKATCPRCIRKYRAATGEPA